MSETTSEHSATPRDANSWAPVDLRPILAKISAGELAGPVPSLMPRADGVALLYPGELHSLAGEPESGKGWLMLATATQLIADGRKVLYIDFEDSAANVTARLLALGASPTAISQQFAYVHPEGSLAAIHLTRLLEGQQYALAVLDGMSEAYALLGLDAYSNGDVPKFLQTLPRPVASTGTAVVLIDHVPKAKDNRGRYAIGAQHKLAGMAVAYGVDVIEQPSRTRAGTLKLLVHKDRHGHIRGHATHGVIALARITPSQGGATVVVALEPPDSTADDGPFRPTVLMERISRHIEGSPGVTQRSIRTAVTGKNDWKDVALSLLIAEGYVEVKQEGQAHRHYSLTSFLETDCAPVPQPRPNRAPGAVQTNRAPVPLPIGGTGTGAHPTPDRSVPTQEHQLINTLTEVFDATEITEPERTTI